MVDLASPRAEPTTNTTTSRTGCHLDRSFFYTSEGIFKCIEIIFSLLGLISISSTVYRYLPRGEWYVSVSVGGFVLSSLFLTLHSYHITEKLKCIPWIIIEFLIYILWSAFYLVAASLAASEGSWNEAMAAAAFFGFVAMCVYLVDGYLKYRQILNRRNAARTSTSPYATSI